MGRDRGGRIRPDIMDYVNCTMKALPETERPYERCWAEGPGVLTDAELLAVILKTGSSGESVLSLSRRLLTSPEHPGLSGLYHVTQQQLLKMRGIGPVKAAQIACVAELSRRIAKSEYAKSLVVRSPEDIIGRYMEQLRHLETEHVLLVMLDAGGALLGEEELSRGTVDMALVSPRDIYLTALRYRAVSIVLLHNHPSGDPQPSMEDFLLTDRVRECGELLGIPLKDHIIIGDHKAVSFADSGYLLPPERAGSPD